MSESKIAAVSYRNLPRRCFTREFKHRVVEQLLDSGLTVAEVAREHELHPNQLCRWRNEYRHEPGSLPAPASAPALLPVVPTSEPAARPVSGPVMGEVGLRISLASGQIHVLNGCAPELLRVTIEALQC